MGSLLLWPECLHLLCSDSGSHSVPVGAKRVLIDNDARTGGSYIEIYTLMTLAQCPRDKAVSPDVVT